MYQIRGKVTCKFCKGHCIKDGHQKDSTQRYECKVCHRKQQRKYRYQAYDPELNRKIVDLTCISVGIRDTAKTLKISLSTLKKRILSIADSIAPPPIPAGRTYQVDEIKTFVGSKRNHIWVMYGYNRRTKSVACFAVGPRTNETLRKVTDQLSGAKRICTDRLRQYKTIIDSAIHCTKNRGTNHIERHNLTIRTHLKRLSRKTICFSRSEEMLYAVLKIYFWGKMQYGL